MTKEIKGWHVATVFVLAFSVIISVNLVLAFNAVRTFPGLEVKNSYVASQSFDEDRATQLALNWDVSAELHGDDVDADNLARRATGRPSNRKRHIRARHQRAARRNT